jgi:hypothetical protein
MTSCQTTLDGKEPTECRSNDGNVVIGFCSTNILMLDLDYHTVAVAKKFSRSYAVFHSLGSALLLKTSDSTQVDLFGNKLDKFSVVFGKNLSWQEIQWHIKECRRLGMIERSFLNLRKFGSITIRVNAKNDSIPPPTIIKLYKLGDMTGIKEFCEFKKIAEPLGKSNNKIQ